MKRYDKKRKGFKTKESVIQKKIKKRAMKNDDESGKNC